MTAAVLPRSHSGSGLAVLATTTNVARLVASIAFGWLWTIGGKSFKPSRPWVWRM